MANVFQALPRIFLLLDACLVSPLSQTAEGFRMSKLKLFAALAICTSVFVILLSSFYYFLNEDFRMLPTLAIIIQISVIVSDIVVMAKSVEDLNYVIYEIHKADRLLTNCDIQTNNNVSHVYTFWYILGSVLTSCIAILEFLLKKTSSSLLIIPLYVVMIVDHGIAFKFMSFVDLLKTKFSDLSIALLEHSRGKQVPGKVSDVSDGAVGLLLASQRLNDLFSLQSVSIYLLHFSLITFLPYWVYSLSTGPLDLQTLGQIIASVYWFLATLHSAWSLSDSADRLAEKAKDFRKILLGLIQNDETQQLYKDIKLRIFTSQKLDIKFSAFGAFPIDNTVIHSMLAAAATYLIILIQFDEESKANVAAMTPNGTALPLPAKI